MHSSPASEGEVDGGAGGEVARAVQGAAPGCRGKGELITAFPTPSLCSLLEKPPSTQAVPPSPSLPPRNIGVIWGDAQPQHSPYPSAPRAAREDARGSERASPPPSSSCCCFGNWRREKERGLIWESRAQAGLVGLGHVRVACGLHPAAPAPARPGGSEGTRLRSLHRSRISRPREDRVPGEMLLEKGWRC